MLQLCLLLLTIPLLTLGGVTVAKLFDQAGRDNARKTYRLAFPSELDPELVAEWLRGISGLMRTTTIGRMLGGTPSIVFETWATEHGAAYLLKIPWQFEDIIRPKLEDLVPGVRLTEDHEARRQNWAHSVEIGLRGGHRPLRINDTRAVSYSILSPLLRLAAGEAVIVQWVVTPAIAAQKPIHGEAVSKENGPAGLVIRTAASKDEVGDSREKLDDTNMLAIVRVAAKANGASRARHLVRAVSSSLEALAVHPQKFHARLVVASELQRRIERAASPLVMPMQLTVSELTALIAWPLGRSTMAGLPAPVSRHLAAPIAVPKEGRPFGMSNAPGRRRPIAMAHQEGTKHTYLLGGTSAGKTTVMANMFRSDVAAGHGAVVIESKGDLFRQALDYIPPGRINDVIVMDLTDSEYPVGFNILRQGNPGTVVDELNMVFDKLYGGDGSGVWFNQVMYHGLHTLATRNDATFNDLAPLLSPTAAEVDWRENIIRNVEDPDLRAFWQDFDNQPRARRDQIAGPVRSRVWQMSRTGLKNIVGQTESSFYMSDVVRNNQILLVNLAGVEPRAAELMGTVVVDLLWNSVKQQHNQNGMFLYLDEFHHYMNIPVDIEQMLVEARSMGLGLVMAHQYLGQLGSDMEQAIMSNARTKLVFQTSSLDARKIADNYGATVTPEDFLHLAKYEAIARISTGDGISSPVTLTTNPPDPGYGLASEVRRISRARYGRPKAQVAEEILNRRTSTQGRKPRRSANLDGWGNLGNG